MEELLPETFPLLTRISRVVRCRGFSVEISENKLIVGYHDNEEYKRFAIIQEEPKQKNIIILYYPNKFNEGNVTQIGGIIFSIQDAFQKENLIVKTIPYPKEAFDLSYDEIHPPLKTQPLA